MEYIIDRIENDMAVCENLKSGEKLEIAMTSIQKSAKEGVVIKKDGDIYIVDINLTKQRRVELTARLDKLFKKHNSL
jgi:CRISPR/Cas system CMR subunit Cmr4 (Cas7 group RAMP superfamily)